MMKKSKTAPGNLITCFPLIDAVLSGSQEGTIFYDDHVDNSFYIIHKAGFSFLAGTGNADYNGILDFLLSAQEIPVYFHVYDAPAQLMSCCEQRAAVINIKVRKRIQLKFLSRVVKESSNLLPPGYWIEPISSANFDQLAVFDLGLADKFWRSKEDFMKHGFGFCLFNETGLPVSICYAAGVAANTAEIDVATLPGYQKKGFAGMVVTEFVKFCIANNITANWDCFEDNIGSVKTAESVGFKHVKTYNFLSVFNKKNNHETQ